MQLSKPEAHKIPSLDGFRAVSILMVILAHAISTIGFPEHFGRRMAIFVSGQLGVRVFFVISGFLITTLLVSEENKRGRISLMAFYKRRALRIWPVFYFFLLTIFVLDHCTGLRAIPASAFFSAATFTTFLWGSWGDTAWPIGHTWSLAVEEQFYLFWPLAILLLKNQKRFLAAAAVVLTVICFRFVWFMSVDTVVTPRWGLTFPTQADAIMSGCLLALVAQTHQQEIKWVLNFHPCIFRFVALALIYVPGWLASTKWIYAFSPTIQSVSIVYLIASFIFVRSGVGYYLLNHKFVQWIGRLSYSLYIWQQLALFPKELKFPHIFWFQQFPQNLTFVFLFAIISYYCIERPFLALKSRFSKVDNAIEGEKP